jgi:hypothetical protein
MLAVRLLLGLVKGLILGGLIGYGLAAAGFGVPAAIIAYPAAAVTGMVVALIAGKPIWAKGARIEVGMKATAGAIFAPLLMWLIRSFLSFGLPFEAGALPGLESLQGQSLAAGTFAVTSLAIVAAVLAGFFDADNAPQPEEEEGAKSEAASKKRIATQGKGAELNAAELEAIEGEAEQQKRKR